MNKPLDKLIGLFCVEAFCGYAGHLIVPFSIHNDKIELFKNDQLKAEWELETISASWRLSLNELVLTGSYEDHEHNDKFLNNIVGLKLTEIKYLNKTDFALIFEKGFKIETFSQGLSHPILEIYTFLGGYNPETHMSLSGLGDWTVHQNEEWTDVEELANNHADKCEKRWKSIVPQKAFDNHCRDCAFFLKISGSYYFMDFGLCSNERSVFDGKVVGVKSSCEHFDFELNQQNTSANST